MRKYLEADGQGKLRDPVDPSRGLIYSQGSLMQHLIFAIIGFYVFKIVEPTIKNKDCME